MRSSQKSPPRARHPATPAVRPAARRFYATLRPSGFTLACPACGTLAAVSRGHGGYRASTQVWTCGNPRCRRRYALGLIAWPLARRHPPVPPADTLPNHVEAAELRALLSLVRSDRLEPRGVVNRVCTCGDCPVHDHAEAPPVVDLSPLLPEEEDQ